VWHGDARTLAPVSDVYAAVPPVDLLRPPGGGWLGPARDRPAPGSPPRRFPARRPV